MQDEMEHERDQCRRLVDTERRETAGTRDKLTAQMAQLKSANEQASFADLFIHSFCPSVSTKATITVNKH